MVSTVLFAVFHGSILEEWDRSEKTYNKVEEIADRDKFHCTKKNLPGDSNVS